MNATAQYRADVDGLRAVAVLSVVFYHAGFSLFPGGYVGVDVFFVISGYLITRILTSELEQGGISYLDFFERRARRILPALFAMLLVTCIPAYILLPPADLHAFAQSLLGATWFSSNFVFWIEAGYFDRASELKPLLHTWSLAVEEQFYLLFPALLALFAKFRVIILGLLVGVGLSFSLALFGLAIEADWPFFMLVSRAWELGMGAVVAAFSQATWCKRLQAKPLLAGIALACGLIMIAIAVLTFSERTPTPGAPLLLPTIGTALILLLPLKTGWPSRVLANPVMRGLGLVSYAFYLWHQPALVYTRFQFGNEPSLASIWAAVVVALVLAILSWWFIERPFRDKTVVSSRKLLVSLLVASALLSGLGLYLQMTDGIRQRVAAAHGDAGHSEYYLAMDSHFERCADEELFYRIEKWKGIPRCHFAKTKAPIKVAFFGDSHAEQLFLGASPLLNTGSIYLIRGGLPFLGEDRFRSPLYFLQEQKSLEVVVYSAYWTEKLSLLGHESFVLRVFETVKWLVQQDLKVVLMMDTPDFGYGPESCLYTETDDTPICSIGSEQHRAEQNRYAETFERIAKHPNVELVDVSDAVCDAARCSMIIDDTLLYRDNDHLNLIGSELAGNLLVSRSQFLKVFGH